MRRTDFHYDLPGELIAQVPLAARSASRLLQVDGAAGCWRDARFADLPSLLAPGDLLVLNDTRVIPARVFGWKASGGRVELLVERLVGEHGLVGQLRASKSPAPGGRLEFEGGATAVVKARAGRDGDLFELAVDRPVLPWLESVGHMPLPPYIERKDDESDRARYQTVFGRNPGAVAAPTAGLHFDQPLLAALAKRGVETATITLHVGAGTFQPVRTEDPREHRLHAERVTVSAAACESGGGRPRPGRAGRGGRHDRGAQPRGGGCRRSARAARGRDGPVHPAGLSLPRGGCAGHELPPAGVLAADAGVRLRGPGDGARRLPPRGGGALSFLQLR
jgi:S-adenosylmethionine:tRNA ribosyltransferase-isomerase